MASSAPTQKWSGVGVGSEDRQKPGSGVAGQEGAALATPRLPRKHHSRGSHVTGAGRGHAAAAAALPAAAPGPGRVYGRRWLVLLLFSLLGFAQGLVWNTWGPIQNSARQAYGFSSWDIALLVLWGPIGFLPCFAFMWLLDKRGLRVTVLLTSFLMVLGTGLRCIPVSDLMLKRRLIHGGQLLNGLAGPTVMNAAPFLSTTWFSADERATATAIASMLSYLGGACAFLVGPLVVPAPNGTSPLLASETSRTHIKDLIEAVLYAEFGVVCLLFSATLVYFPPRPPLPPSVAAASQRLSYRRSFCRLLSNMRFLMIALAYAIPLGVFAGWSGVLDLILTPVHVSQCLPELSWFNWCLPGSCLLSLLLILCFRESYDRLYLDVVVSV
ncbi:solute carrier family 49 member 4 [Leptonychotes weddellii]|uniref:Solute carrier family 49 member 4 n=1 Tax=Leptonychotes weddellii TaxID=9713 RepID=A0A7F8RQ12_LEPWE|nr:solute carrier family 49 member 4 [Leptonychotes weddellii]